MPSSDQIVAELAVVQDKMVRFLRKGGHGVVDDLSAEQAGFIVHKLSGYHQIAIGELEMKMPSGVLSLPGDLSVELSGLRADIKQRIESGQPLAVQKGLPRIVLRTAALLNRIASLEAKT